MAAWAAAFTGPGTSKSGCPIERLIGCFRVRARSNTLRMPDDSMCRIRPAIQWSGIGLLSMGSASQFPAPRLVARAARGRLLADPAEVALQFRGVGQFHQRRIKGLQC